MYMQNGLILPKEFLNISIASYLEITPDYLGELRKN